MTFPFPFVPPVSVPVDISNTANNNSSTGLTTYTFAAQSLGVATADRQIYVAVAGQRLSSPASVLSLSANGVSCSLVVSKQTGNANDHTVEIWKAAVPTGTTGDIVVTFSTAYLRCLISVFRVVNASTSAYATASATNSSSAVSASINIPAGGGAIAAVFNNGSTSYTWTNITERYDVGSGALNTFSSASDNFATAQTALSLTATQASNNPPQAFVAASVGQP